MLEYLPLEVRDGLAAARRAERRRKSRLRVLADGKTHRILRIWHDGFALDIEDLPHLRGLVDIYDGSRHLYQCLIVASSEDGDEVSYEFKRNTPAVDRAPLDFEHDEDAPVILLPR